jgi:hypothetical protein
MSKIAPTLQQFFCGKRSPFRDPEDDAAMRAELRALLAVARAAKVRIVAGQPWRNEAALGRALARLEKVSK